MAIRLRKVKPVAIRRYSSGAAVEPILSRSRKKYREERGSKFELSNCLRSLSYFEDQAVHLPVAFEDNNTVFTAPVYNVQTVAELLEKTYQTFWRWTKEPAIVPPPVLIPVGQKGRTRLVYHREEVRAMITIIGEHEKAFKYYRADHMQTRKKLFDAIDAIRTNLKEENQHGNQKGKPSLRKRRPV